MDLQHEVEQFLYRQSELLDTKQWQAWIDLFAPDGVYWNSYWEDDDLHTLAGRRPKTTGSASASIASA